MTNPYRPRITLWPMTEVQDQRTECPCFHCRTNLSFASVQLNHDLGFDDQTYGLGAGKGCTHVLCMTEQPGTLGCPNNSI